MEQAILNIVSKDRNQITIDSLRAGSILSAQTLNVNNPNEQNNMVVALQNALLTNSLLAGFPIEASAVISSNGDTGYNPYINTELNDEARRYRNIAIIIGTVIPVGLSNYFYNFSYYLRGLFHSL